MAQWTSQTPHEQKTRVRFPPGCSKAYRENIAMLLYTIDIVCIVCVLKKRKKGIGRKIYFLNKSFLTRISNANYQKMGRFIEQRVPELEYFKMKREYIHFKL
jgi:hypothetical protein